MRFFDSSTAADIVVVKYFRGTRQYVHVQIWVNSNPNMLITLFFRHLWSGITNEFGVHSQSGFEVSLKTLEHLTGKVFSESDRTEGIVTYWREDFAVAKKPKEENTNAVR